MKTLVCIGDSLVEGEGDELNLGGWVGRLAQKLPGYNGIDDGRAWRVFNLGIGGNTIRDVKYRSGEVVVREPEVIVVGCGGNDVRYTSGETWDGLPEHNLSLALTQAAWTDTLAILTKMCPLVAVIGRYPVKYTSTKEEDCVKHNAFIEAQCRIAGAVYIAPPAFLADSGNISHGSHPNAAGYALYSDYVFTNLSQLNWI